jgi:putative membrane protein
MFPLIPLRLLPWITWGSQFTMVFWFMLIVLIALAVAVIVTAPRRALSTGAGSSSDQAMEILKERFARGEISKAEFDEMRRALT